MSLAHIDQSNSPAIHIDQQAILRALKLNPADPNTQALLLVCDRYGLDPLLKHMVLITGNPYVTRDGYLHIAHASGQFDGIEVVEQGENDTHWTAKVAVYRKDMTRPIAYTGRFPKSKQQMREYGPEMAVKCAEVAALRRAFNVTGIGAADERWDVNEDDVIEATSTDAEPATVSAAAAKSALLSALIDRGWTPDDAKAEAKRMWGDRGSGTLTQSAVDMLIGQIADDPFGPADRTISPTQSPLPTEAAPTTPSGPAPVDTDTTPIGNKEGQNLHRRLGAILVDGGHRAAWIQAELVYHVTDGRTTHASELTLAETVTVENVAKAVAAGNLSPDEIKAVNDEHRAQGA
jgi:hypothetical protein